MRGSIQPRGKGVWRLVFDLERDHTGQRRQRVITFEGNRSDAEAELTQQLAKAKNGGFVESHSLTVAEYLEHWLDNYATAATAPKTLERYTEICRLHLAPALGASRLMKLTPMQIQAYYTDAQKTGRRDGKGGLSARTVLHHHRVLRQALLRAVKCRLLTINPTDATYPPKPEARELNVLDEQETAKLLAGADGTTLFMPTLLAVTTGLRRGEVLALRWGSVDFDRSELSVVQSLEQTKAGLRFKPPKTKRSRRVVTLPAFTVEALRRHKVEQAQLRLRIGLGRDENGLVCPRYDGQPRSPHAFTKEFSRLVAKLNIPRITYHGLRHSHATQLLRAGIHPKVAQERLGHATIATTMDLYSHVTESMQEDAAIRIDTGLRAAISKLAQRPRSQ